MIVQELEDASNMPNWNQWKLTMENRDKINELVRVVNRIIEANPILAANLNHLIHEHGREAL